MKLLQGSPIPTRPPPLYAFKILQRPVKKLNGIWHLQKKSKGKLRLKYAERNRQYLQIKRSRLCQLRMLLLILI